MTLQIPLTIKNAVKISAVALTLAVLGQAAPAHAADPTGLWLTGAGDARIRVARCGAGMCGTIVWLKDPIDRATGKPQRDDKNTDPGKQSRPILGLQIFSMAPNETGKWSGRIYNADDGKTYAASIALDNPSALKVTGCVGALCGSETWTRVETRASAR
jgi:uncharacterized protein (DUF2147 family)